MQKIESISEITKYMDDLQAIIFDLDNVLYPLDDYVQSGFHQISRLFLGHSLEVYDQLWNRGVRLGLLIDGPAEMQREKLRALGIIPLFDEIIITDDIAGHGDVMKFRKPNPICFEIMQLRLNVPFEKMGYIVA